MVLSMAAFVVNDTIVKLVLQEMPLFPTLFVRGLVATGLLYILRKRSRAVEWTATRREYGLIALRTAAEIGGTLTFLTALAQIPIANATAILQAAPLAVTLTAAVVLREVVGWRRYTAIAIGFLGVLLIVRPGSEGFSGASLWAVATVGFMVVRDLSTRRLSSDVPSIYVALATALAIMTVGAFGCIAVPIEGANAWTLGLSGIAGIVIVVAYLSNVESMRHGEIGFVAPFRYTGLLWAILLGWLVFEDVPEALTLIGAAIVVVTGGYTFYRERLVRRRASAMRPFGAS